MMPAAIAPVRPAVHDHEVVAHGGPAGHRADAVGAAGEARGVEQRVGLGEVARASSRAACVSAASFHTFWDSARPLASAGGA